VRAGVHELRTLSDAGRLRHALTAKRSAVVVGAGSSGWSSPRRRKCGLDVTVREAGARPTARALSPRMSDQLAGAHRRMGTDLRVDESMTAITGDCSRAESPSCTRPASP